MFPEKLKRQSANVIRVLTRDAMLSHATYEVEAVAMKESLVYNQFGW